MTESRSRLHYQLALLEADRYKVQDHWPVLLDPDGFIAEGPGFNVFVVKDEAVITPEGRNILRGISRGYVLSELCPQLGIPCVEKNIEVYDAMHADEMFVTSTPFCILPVTSLNGSPIGDGLPGRTTRSLLSAWSANVGVDIAAQIKAWNETPNAQV